MQCRWQTLGSIPNTHVNAVDWTFESILSPNSYAEILTPTIIVLGNGDFGRWLSHRNGAFQFTSVQSLSRARLFATPWLAAHQASLFINNSRSSLRLMPSSHLILCCPLLLLPPIPPSITVFSNESTLCMRWPKYWSFSLNISPSNEHPGLISFRMDWLDLLEVQGTLKSLL